MMELNSLVPRGGHSNDYLFTIYNLIYKNCMTFHINHQSMYDNCSMSRLSAVFCLRLIFPPLHSSTSVQSLEDSG